jgi:hypothetical protein
MKPIKKIPMKAILPKANSIKKIPIKADHIEDSQSSIYIQTYNPTKDINEDIEIPVYKSIKK